MQRYAVLKKQVGETPRATLERYRTVAGISTDVPLAYAGRLDPLASGELLILIGEECKRQKAYHGLDKAYEFEMLSGISSDTGDVLGMPTLHTTATSFNNADISSTLRSYIGTQTFPYPHFSSKTVGGKPLFLWTLEGRLDEITIPTITSQIYNLRHVATSTMSADTLRARIVQKIESIPPVTDQSKMLGNDFRRPDIRNAWQALFSSIPPDAQFTIIKCSCIVSSGTYIRTLAPAIATSLGTSGLAFSIHRTTIGRYVPITLPLLPPTGIWMRTY